MKMFQWDGSCNCFSKCCEATEERQIRHYDRSLIGGATPSVGRKPYHSLDLAASPFARFVRSDCNHYFPHFLSLLGIMS